MEFTCNSEELARAVSYAEKAAAQKSPLSHLEGMYVSAIGQEVIFYCTDKDFGVECTVPANVDVEGEAVINARLLADVARSLPDSSARMSDVDRSQIRIVSGDASFVLHRMQSEAFPPFPEIERKGAYRVDQFALKRMMQQTAFAISQDSTRKSITGLFLEGDGFQLRAVAVDGFRLALRRQPVDRGRETDGGRTQTAGGGTGDGGQAPGGNAGDGGQALGSGTGDGGSAGSAGDGGQTAGGGTGGTGDVINAGGSIDAGKDSIGMIIPSKSVAELIKILPSESGEMSLFGNQSQAILQFGRCRVFTRVIDGEFFNYKYILSDEYVTQLVVQKPLLQEAVERSMLVLETEKLNRFPVSFKLSNGYLEINAKSDIGIVHDRLEVESVGEDIEAHFNPKYIYEALRAIEEDVIIMRFATRVGQLVFLPTSHDGFTYLTLPVRVDAR